MKGKIVRVSGPTVRTALPDLKLYERVLVKDLTGEVVRVDSHGATIQIYEDSRGLSTHDEVEGLGAPLSVRLGPGMLGEMYDGLQRPLNKIKEQCGPFITESSHTITGEMLGANLQIEYTALKKAGERVGPGEIVGSFTEGAMTHYLSNITGTEEVISENLSGSYHGKDILAHFESGRKLSAHHDWPVRLARPHAGKLPCDEPLITGQRSIDFLFPLARGGSAIIPGGFGAGKTILEQSIARHADVDVVVYAGCGERGNEMADLLSEFRELEDRHTGRPLLERTVLVVNTSNMPVAAREASIYTAVTIAEYYRDQGLDVLLLADSISRWAEALREISTSLEEMPGEEGYPTYLASRLSAYTERAGRVRCLNGKTGSLSMILSVSPPGGDFTEPVTQALLRNTGVLLMLDTALAQRRHFPAINWFNSYSLFEKELCEHFKGKISHEWHELRMRATELLQREESLSEVAEIVGRSGMQPVDQLLLDTAERIRTEFLAQNAYTEDSYSTPAEMVAMIKDIFNEYDAKLAKLEKKELLGD